MDARQRRSRDALGRAVLRLAAERPISAISASEIAQLAELNRSTFYQHAESPADLLRLVVTEQLDAVRTRYLEGATRETIGEAIGASTSAVLDHVERYDQVYIRALGAEGESALHSTLSRHFRASIELLFDRGALSMPGGEFLRSAASRFIADGSVGLMDVWLRTPAPRDRGVYLRAFMELTPEWWPVQTEPARLG
jgi:AcrR family transcriptional regulator